MSKCNARPFNIDLGGGGGGGGGGDHIYAHVSIYIYMYTHMYTCPPRPQKYLVFEKPKSLRVPKFEHKP